MRNPKQVDLTVVRLPHADRAKYCARLRRNGYRRVGPVVMERGLCETWYEKRNKAVNVVSNYMGGGR